MKTIKILFLLFIGLSLNSFGAKPVKVLVSQDVFVQGGETADTALGATKSDRLRIMNSEASSKYARITYLQFNTKKIQDFNKVEMKIRAKVYESKIDPTAKFELQVYALENDKWKQTGMTWNNKPEKGELLATIDMVPTKDKAYDFATITLPADKIKSLMGGKKDGKVSLVLFNKNFNKTGCEIISRERTWSDGKPTKSEAVLKFY